MFTKRNYVFDEKDEIWHERWIFNKERLFRQGEKQFQPNVEVSSKK